jgi:hypothetical protein
MSKYYSKILNNNYRRGQFTDASRAGNTEEMERLIQEEYGGRMTGGAKAKLIKALEADAKQLKADVAKERYELLNIPVCCPICGIDTNFNKIKIHFKRVKCTALSELLPNEKYLGIISRVNKIVKIATNKELTPDERKKEIVKLSKESKKEEEDAENIYQPMTTEEQEAEKKGSGRKIYRNNQTIYY